MRTKTSLAILLSNTALASQPVFAKEGTELQEEQLQAKLTAQRQATRTLAHKMMVHISLASVALDSRLPEVAQDHVKKARREAR